MESKNVKSIQTFIHNQLALVDFSDADSNGRYLASIKEFDPKGNVVKEISYRPDGLIENNYTNLYDANNNLIEHNLFDDDHQLLESHKYDLDESGRVVGESCFYAEMEDQDYTSYIYDDQGFLVEKRNIDSDQELYSLIMFTFIGKKIETEKHYNDENKLESEKRFEYNAKGECIAESHIDYLEDDFRKYTFEYNELGHRIKTLSYNNKNQLVAKSLFEYDEKGVNNKLIEEDRNGLFTTIFEHNEKGKLMLQEKFNDEDELMVRWVYEYENDLLVLSKTYIRDEHSDHISEDEEDENTFEMVNRVTTEYVYEFH